MQARWTLAAWRLASAGLLAFTQEEAQRIRSSRAILNLVLTWFIYVPACYYHKIRVRHDPQHS
jgi:hypothetical protein